MINEQRNLLTHVVKRNEVWFYFVPLLWHRIVLVRGTYLEEIINIVLTYDVLLLFSYDFPLNVVW